MDFRTSISWFLILTANCFAALGNIEVKRDGGKLIFNNNSQTVSFSASASMSESVDYIFPVADGDSGQVLITNGFGVRSWVDVNAVAGIHKLLTVTHTDAVNADVTRGSIIYGNSTPKWGELVIGASEALLRSDGTDVVWGSGAITITDGGLLCTGTTDGYTIPSGAGTRLMWIPNKYAFRAGQVDGTQWNSGNIGNWSSAFGFNGIASGLASAHWGRDGEASGTRSAHFGFFGSASGTNSIHTGSTNLADCYALMTLGRFSAATGGNRVTWDATDPILVIGNGADADNRSNVFTIYKNGNLLTDGTINSGVITQSDFTLDNTYQALDDVLTDLSALAVVADNQFIVGSGAGTYAYESPLQVLATLSGQAGATFSWNNKTLQNIASLFATDIFAANQLHLLDSGTGNTNLRIEALDNAYSANRLLSIDLGNRDRILTFSGGADDDSVTIGDWFDQRVKMESFPLFSGIGTTGDTDLLDLAVDALTVNGTIDSNAITQNGLTLDNTYHPLTTVGIAQNNLVEISAADVAVGDYARFTATGLEGRTRQELEVVIDHDNLFNFVGAEHINWTNASNNFKTSGTGEFTNTLGVGIAPVSTFIIKASKDISFAGRVVGIFGGITNTLITGGGASVIGLAFTSIMGPSSTTANAINADDVGGILVTAKLQGAPTATYPLTCVDLFGVKSNLAVSESSVSTVTATSARGFWATNPSVSGDGASIETLYAFFDEGMTTGLTDWGFYGESAYNYLSGLLAFRQTDKNEYIASKDDGFLDLGATTEIRLNQATTIGDGGTTNYATFADDGLLTLVGTARVSEDIQFVVTTLKPGASAPTAAIVGITPVLKFDTTTDDEAHLVLEIPHNYDNDSDLLAHFHWAPTTAAAGNVTWGIEYHITRDENNEILTEATTTLIVVDATQGLQDEVLDSGTIVINGSGLQSEDHVHIRIFRDADASEAGASDTYAADASLISFDVEYMIDSLGEDTQF